MRIAKFISALILAVLLVETGIGCATYVRVAPPPPKTEIKPPSPSPTVCWVPGHWRYTKHGWVWVSGHWKKKPRPATIWIPGKWVKTPRGWEWKPGHWK